LPNAAAVWILEGIGGFENDPAILTHLLDKILQGDKPRLPPEVRDAVLEAANELKVMQFLRSDERMSGRRPRRSFIGSSLCLRKARLRIGDFTQNPRHQAVVLLFDLIPQLTQESR
jgi:hypothetical protein